MANGTFEEISDLSGIFEQDDSSGNTLPLDDPDSGRTKIIEDHDDGATQIFMPDSVKLDPAVGWLVCIEGIDKGKSFRLTKGNNTIGRSSGEKRYAVSLTDQSISRKGAVSVIVYNEKTNKFFITPGALETKINPYLNDEIILSPRQLNARDRLEIGGDVLIFMPFCSDKFKWQFNSEEKAQEESGHMVRCPKGHRYDSSLYRSCPECKKQKDNDPDGETTIWS